MVLRYGAAQAGFAMRVTDEGRSVSCGAGQRQRLRSLREKCASKQGPTRITTNETKVSASSKGSLISMNYFGYNFCVTGKLYAYGICLSEK